MKKFAYWTENYDLIYALRNHQVADTFREAVECLVNEWNSSNPSRKRNPDWVEKRFDQYTEFFIEEIDAPRNAILIDHPISGPEIWGNLKKACASHGWPYNTLSKKKMPIEYDGAKIYRMPIL